MASYGLLWFLTSVPVLVAQWVGIVALRRAGKSGAWWTMTVGTTCITIAPIASAVVMGMIYSGLSGSSGLGSGTTLANATDSLWKLGSLLFAIGFAMHGLKASRAASRMQDLGQLTAAMSEEIERLRQGGQTA